MKTLDEAYARGAADGRAGLGAIPPRDPALKAAYMQSYRDALVARVGVPERRRKNPRVQWGIYRQDNRTGQMVRLHPSVDGRPRVFHTRKAAVEFAYDGFIAGQRNTHVEYRREANPRAKRKRRCKGGARAPCSIRRIRARARNPRAKRRPKITTTVARTSTKTVRKVNRRAPPALVVLYAHKPGMRRLKYLGRGKFGEKGKAMLFKSRAGARLAAWVLRDTHPAALRGWTLTAS